MGNDIDLLFILPGQKFIQDCKKTTAHTPPCDVNFDECPAPSRCAVCFTCEDHGEWGMHCSIQTT